MSCHQWVKSGNCTKVIVNKSTIKWYSNVSESTEHLVSTVLTFFLLLLCKWKSSANVDMITGVISLIELNPSVTISGLVCFSFHFFHFSSLVFVCKCKNLIFDIFNIYVVYLLYVQIDNEKEKQWKKIKNGFNNFARLRFLWSFGLNFLFVFW